MQFSTAVIKVSFTLALLAYTASSVSAQRGGGPKPQLYPNEHLKKVGQAQANVDIAACSDQAAAYIHNSQQPGQGLKKGARGAARGALLGTLGGAIAGNTGRGAGAGAAMGATSSALKGIGERGARNPEFQTFANACLEDKGYKVLSWK